MKQNFDFKGTLNLDKGPVSIFSDQSTWNSVPDPQPWQQRNPRFRIDTTVSIYLITLMLPKFQIPCDHSRVADPGVFRGSDPIFFSNVGSGSVSTPSCSANLPYLINYFYFKRKKLKWIRSKLGLIRIQLLPGTDFFLMAVAESGGFS
mgnify:CR=1 FL=1